MKLRIYTATQMIEPHESEEEEMTNSEAVSLLMNSQYYKQGYNQGVSDTLDKIRAEIDKETDRDNHADDYCDGYYDGMRNALAIIDKYKSELNPQESEVEE